MKNLFQKHTSKATLLAVSMLLILSACDEWGFRITPGPPSPPRPTVPFRAEVAFSQTANQAGKRVPEAQLVDYLYRANETVTVFLPELTNQAVLDALIVAKNNSVAVNVKTNQLPENNAGIAKLKAAQIPVAALTSYTNSKLTPMNYRFVVIDKRYVWVSSSPMTAADQQQNDQSSVVFNLPALAENFLKIYEDDPSSTTTFGDIPSSDAPNSNFSFLTTRSTAFSRWEVESYVMREIAKAKSSIQFLSSDLTNRNIATALIDRSKRGVAIKGVLDRERAQQSDSQYNTLKDAGLDIRLDGNPHTMGHQIIIIDEKNILLGSDGLKPADQNENQMLGILNDAPLTETYLQEFSRIYQSAQ